MISENHCLQNFSIFSPKATASSLVEGSSPKEFRSVSLVASSTSSSIGWISGFFSCSLLASSVDFLFQITHFASIVGLKTVICVPWFSSVSSLDLTKAWHLLASLNRDPPGGRITVMAIELPSEVPSIKWLILVQSSPFSFPSIGKLT